MTYQYRGIRVEFDDPVRNERWYRFYSNGDYKNRCVDYGKVTVGREVADLSNCAMREFARKYIDVNFRRLCTVFLQGTELIRPPLSTAAFAAAVRIQDAANKVVKSVAQSHDDVVALDHADLAFDLNADGCSVQDYIDVILEGVKELPGYQSFDADANELRVMMDRQQVTDVEQDHLQMSL